ncbi:MAG TPA: transcriptional repressor [Cytophagaceae bacterium]|jgi:Fur family ferric uptake transcriptional regulator|nr:transcriptional repressor [Cytophagaceae bacterium]
MKKNTNEQIELLLKENNLKKTPIRRDILNLYLSKPYALSQNDIEAAFSKKEYDRITLYRTLKTFEESGIIHKIYDPTGVAKFSLCPSGCTKHKHTDEHAHFNCITCHHTYCMPTVPAPKVIVPEGFHSLHYSYSIEGICISCKSK